MYIIIFNIIYELMSSIELYLHWETNSVCILNFKQTTKRIRAFIISYIVFIIF